MRRTQYLRRLSVTSAATETDTMDPSRKRVSVRMMSELDAACWVLLPRGKRAGATAASWGDKPSTMVQAQSDRGKHTPRS